MQYKIFFLHISSLLIKGFYWLVSPPIPVSPTCTLYKDSQFQAEGNCPMRRTGNSPQRSSERSPKGSEIMHQLQTWSTAAWGFLLGSWAQYWAADPNPNPAKPTKRHWLPSVSWRWEARRVPPFTHISYCRWDFTSLAAAVFITHLKSIFLFFPIQ